MRLLFVIDSFGSGGAQRQMINLAIGLARRQHSVEFFIYHPQYRHFAQVIEDAAIPVHIFHKTQRYSLAVVLALRALIQRGNYDIVLAFLDTPSLYAELAMLGTQSTALVVSERYMFPPGKLSFKKRLMQQCHSMADRITVNSYHQRQRMIEEFPWMQNRITTIYNGVDLDRFLPDPLNEETEHASVSLLAVGTVVRKKNPVALAQALVHCRRQLGIMPTIKWAGKQDKSPDGLQTLAYTNDILKENGLQSCWDWIGEQGDIPGLLRKHDALVHPAYFEGLPNAICEALACGRPVLASQVGDHSRLVSQGVTGFLFDPEDPTSIARAIAEFASLTSAARAVMGKRAREFAETHLSLARYVDTYENLFINLTQ